MPYIEGRFSTKRYDKRNYFNFPIVNFSFICGNIPATPAYGAYVCQLVYGFWLSLSYIQTVLTTIHWQWMGLKLKRRQKRWFISIYMYQHVSSILRMYIVSHVISYSREIVYSTRIILIERCAYNTKLYTACM
jgi:hypothetical protein